MKTKLTIPGIVAILSVISFSLQAKQWFPIKNQTTQKVSAKLLLQSGEVSTIQFNVPGYSLETIQTPQGAASILSAEKATPLLIPGAPELLKMTASLIIPDQKNMDVEVIASSFHDYQNIQIAPSKGNLYRTQNPSDVPFVYGPEYNSNQFYPGKLTELRNPFVFRDFRGQTVVVYPFQYNPVTKVLRVYEELTVKVSPSLSISSSPSFSRTRAAKPNAVFSPIYNSRLINFNQTQYTPTQEIGDMLVIADASLMATMQPFVDWKNRMGQKTEMVDVATIGTNPSDIKSYIENKFNTDGITFVLFAGDGPQIPPYPSSNGPSDPSYGDIIGNDSYPEVIVGRFSANTPSELETQIERSLNYEMHPDPSGQWYHKGVCIGSDQGPGDDNEMDFEHEQNIRQKLLSYTYTDDDELFDGSQGGVDMSGDPTPMDLVTSMNQGRGIITYTGHGSQNSFGTTSFSSGDVADLTNENMLPFVWSVACVNGDFSNGDCLAEALMRSTNSSGAATGAIATFMSTINQSWNPPMDAQDEMVDILVETYPGNIKHTFGGISVNGCMHMNDEYGSAGVEMTDTWTCFGDPSLTVRTDTPEPIPVAHDATIDENASSWIVQCNVDQALVCLSHHNQIVSTGYALSGSAYLNISGLTLGDTLDLTVTAYNRIPYFATVVVVPNGTTAISGLNSEQFAFTASPLTSLSPSHISFSLPATANVSLNVYSNTGQLVNQIFNNRKLNSGKHDMVQNDTGLSKGIYLLKLTVDSKEIVKRLIVE